MKILDKISSSFKRVVLQNDIERFIEDDDVVCLSPLTRNIEDKPASLLDIMPFLFSEDAGKVVVVPYDVWISKTNAKEFFALCRCVGLLEENVFAVFANDLVKRRLLDSGAVALYERDRGGKVYGGGILGKITEPFRYSPRSPALPLKNLPSEFLFRINLARMLVIMLLDGKPFKSENDVETASSRFTAFTEGFVFVPDIKCLPGRWIFEFSKTLPFYDWNAFVPDEKTFNILKRVIACHRIKASAMEDEWTSFQATALPVDIRQKCVELGLKSAFEAYDAGVPIDDIVM